MNTKDLIRLGVPPGETNRRGMDFIARYLLKGLDKLKLPDGNGVRHGHLILLKNPPRLTMKSESGKYFDKRLNEVRSPRIRSSSYESAPSEHTK